jgi:hypothetical protein
MAINGLIRHRHAAAFTMVVKQQDTAQQTQHVQDPRLQPLLSIYADVFGPTSMATVREELAPEAIPIRKE